MVDQGYSIGFPDGKDMDSGTTHEKEHNSVNG